MTEPTKIPAADLLAHFEKIRMEQGEEAYQAAKNRFAMGMILKDRGDEYLKNLFPDMDLDQVRAEAQKAQAAGPQLNAHEAMLNAFRGQVPNLKTQAQFTLFMRSFDALRMTMNAAFGLDKDTYEQGKKALGMVVDSAFKLSEVVQTLSENPEAATSKAAEEFKSPPKEFHEYDIQKSLLTELAMLKNGEELQRWYDNNRTRMDGVVSQSLRNELFDAIRVKKKELEEAN